MSQDNPYAAPQSMGGEGPRLPLEGSSGGLWRSGPLLVMHRDARLPPFCIKTNQPATHWLKRDLSWHNPLIFFTLLIHILLYVILALIFRKRATIEVGLCEAAFRRRRRAILIAWLLALGGIGLLVGTIITAASGRHDERLMWLMIVAALVVFFTGCGWGIAGARVVTPKRIDASHLWLKGAAAEYLERFPEAPAELAR